MMARRARMLALLQLPLLVLLLMAELTHTAPVSEGSNINTIHDVGDGEKHDDALHTVVPEDSVAEGDNHAVTVQDVNSVSQELLDTHEDSMVTKAADDVSSVGSAEINVDKDLNSTSTKSEDDAGVTEASKEVPEENTDKPNSSLNKSEDVTGAADGGLAVSEANVDTQELAKTGENGETTESSNAVKHEGNTSTEHEEDSSARDTKDAASMEKTEDPMTNNMGQNADDSASKENLETADDFVIGGTSEDGEEDSEESMDKHEVKTTEEESGKEQIVTVMTSDETNEDSEEFVEASKDNKVEKDAVESSDKGSEENKESERVEETALEKDDTSEDESTEERNKEMEDKHGAVLGNSSEETSDAEYEAEDIEVNENQNSTHQESHVTSSPFARLSVPNSGSHLIEEDEQHSNKDAAAMEGHEKNPSVEETAENEAGSPDELIEHDRVDSEVIKSDNKTAALGKAMPITGAEEDAQNEDESSQDTSKDSQIPAVLKELEKTEEKNVIEHQGLNNENEEEKVETTINEAPTSTNETKSKVIVLGGKLLDDNEGENEKDNFLDKDEMLPKGPLDYSSKENEDEYHVDEATVDVAHVTEDPSEEEGSGIALDMIGFASHGDNAHKDTSDTSSQEKHETENREEEKVGNQDDEDAIVSEKEETNLSKETGHHTDDFEDSGSGHEEEQPENGKQDHKGTNDVEDGVGSGSYALPGHYEDDMVSEEPITKSNVYSVASHVPVVGDNEGSSTENHTESPVPENETFTKTAIFESANDKNESGDPFEEENLVQNNTNVHVMSFSPTAVPDENDDHHVTFEGSGDDDTTTPVAILINADIIDDNMAVSSMEMDLVNSSLIGNVSPAYQEKPVAKVISSQSAAAPSPQNTEAPCIADEKNDDCLLQSRKLHGGARVTNILEDDDEVPPEPTKDDIHTESTADDHPKEQAVITTTPATRVYGEEDSSEQSIAVDLNKPLLHSNEEIRSTTIAPEIQEITEPIEHHEALDNETTNIGAPDTIIEQPQEDTGIKEMSGKIRAANVNELGVSGQESSDDLGEPEALDSSSASGSYVVLGCIMAVVVILLAYAAIKSRRERGNNTTSKKQSEVAGDDDDGTELKDMKKALLPPEAPHDDCNGDIEANRKPLMDKTGDQEEDEEKEPIIKQNGTVELSEPSRDIESQADSPTAENQQKMKTVPTPNKPQERNGLSEVVVEKPALSNGKADNIITHPVAAKVKVIENEDSIAKMPVIINRGANSPPH